MSRKKGGFTLPGESGYEELTLKLAEKWGADVIRDSDGTELSEDIIHAGYGIYSTICVIRDHNAWAKENTDKLQQTFLCTQPAVAVPSEDGNCSLTVGLMDDFFEEQFRINDSERAMKYWQVYDRTSNRLVDEEGWSYDRAAGTVRIGNAVCWHKYTVSFFGLPHLGRNFHVQSHHKQLG